MQPTGVVRTLMLLISGLSGYNPFGRPVFMPKDKKTLYVYATNMTLSSTRLALMN